MSGLPAVLLLLLLAASSSSSSVFARDWAGGRDAINTGPGVEDPEPRPVPLPLHPPHPPTPPRFIPFHTDEGAPGYEDDSRSSYPDMSMDEDQTSGSSLGRLKIPQSSTSQQFFQSSSFYETKPEDSRASGSHMMAGRQPYHLSELPSSSSSSSAPPSVALWPDPPPPAAPPSSMPAATRAAVMPPPTPRSSSAANRDSGSPFPGHSRQRKPRLRSDTPDGRKKRLRTSDSVRSGWSNRKHQQPLGLRGPSGNTRYLKSNIQPDRGKSQSYRRRFRTVRQNRDGSIAGHADSIESADDQTQDDSETLISTETKPDRNPELKVGKKNVTGQVLHQFPGHSKETRHEKLTQEFPTQVTEEEESTKTFSEELREIQSREGERETLREYNVGANTASKDVESVAEGNVQEIKPLVTDAADNIKDFGLNDTTLRKPQHVNLDTLEMELSQKDEEAASDLLLAISILQHHLVPDMSEKRMDAQPHNTSNISSLRLQPIADHSTYSTSELQGSRQPPAAQESDKKYNIEIFDALSPTSDGGADENEKNAEENKTSMQQLPSMQDNLDVRDHGASHYRWFVLVLDGNCSVIKHRMTVFVTFLKAALSSKLSIDNDDVFVPSVFCDNTFMVNISLDTIKNPQVETKLRTLAEANTTLLEISEEIFYLEKILTKRTDEENQDLQPVVKKPDDVELVIYIAVGCMCMFILLSVVIVLLIRVCRQEGDQLELGSKPHPHQIIPRSLDFPIRRPNVIYSHRFTQTLTPGKCGRRGLDEVGGASTGVAVVAVGGAGGRGSLLRYDPELVGDLAVNGDEVYSIAGLTDDPYHDRRALVPARRRVTHTPGEDVILEEDLAEEEEEDDDDEDEEERRRRTVDLPEDEVLLEEDMEEDGDSNQVHRPETPRVVSSSTSSSGGIVRATWVSEGVGRGVHGSGAGSRGLYGAGPNDVLVTGSGEILSGIDNPCYNR